MKYPKILHDIHVALSEKGAKAIVVGGSVRDHFMGLESKDFDIEVYGLGALLELEALLGRFGTVRLVGKSFGVLKFVHEGKEYDFSFPRREKKSGEGHRGFSVVTDGFMSYEEAARRRDFTINAMGYDLSSHTFLDPFGGREDMEAKMLRHIDDQTFIEDPLRLYRGVQFCARFEYRMSGATKALCALMTQRADLESLPKERIFEELKKLLLKSAHPSLGLNLLKELGVLRYFPHLQALTESAWNHTLKSLDLLTCFPCRTLSQMFSLMTMHLGEKERTETLLSLTDETHMIEEVGRLSPLIMMIQMPMRDSDVRRLSCRVCIEDLSPLLTASDPTSGAGEILLHQARALGVSYAPPKPLLQGRDLIVLGLKPSNHFSTILDAVYELQLEGTICQRADALAYVKIHYMHSTSNNSSLDMVIHDGKPRS